ncbi:hypothetical protein E4T39_07348 [Aureobasidium subglaciale]|nr:hypothetical protein E4T39_07348 [Aureobasidium subglaciale]
MPPPYRQPSQVGATAATKRPFKPPIISRGEVISSSSIDVPSRPSSTTTAPPKPIATSSKAPFATGSRPQSWANNTTSGFQSAGAQIDKSDLEAMLISDEEDDDDGFSAALTRRPAPPTTVEPAAKRQKTIPPVPTRLPSLSPLSSAIQPAPVPPQPQHTAATGIGGPKDDIPLLPSALITRLLHESFDDKSVKIGKDANALTARYLDLFVREAVARATEVAKERKEMKEAGGQGDQEVWLDVQDLEEVAPGLVLDF